MIAGNPTEINRSGQNEGYKEKQARAMTVEVDRVEILFTMLSMLLLA